MELLKVVLPAVVILGLAMLGLALNMIIKKGGKFPNTHVSGNKHLKRNKVYCSQTQDRVEQINAFKSSKFDNVKLVIDEKAAK